MNIVLSGLNEVEMFVFMDDVIIYAKNLDEHTVKLKNFLERMKSAGLTQQPEKCKFLRKKNCLSWSSDHGKRRQTRPKQGKSGKEFSNSTNEKEYYRVFRTLRILQTLC